MELNRKKLQLHGEDMIGCRKNEASMAGAQAARLKVRLARGDRA